MTETEKMVEQPEPKGSKPSESDKIWNEVADLPIAMYSLPNQRVRDHVKRLAGFPNAVLLTLNAPAVLPSLEATLNGQTVVHEERAETPHGDSVRTSYPKYVLEEAEGYVIVKRNNPPPERDELKLRPEYFIADSDEK